MREKQNKNSRGAILIIGITLLALCASSCSSFKPAKKETIPVRISGGNQ